jgi:hypothetical protein
MNRQAHTATAPSAKWLGAAVLPCRFIGMAGAAPHP